MIVTISRAYGAAGKGVARALAERLEYRLLDDGLPVAVATHLGTSADVVSSVAERPPGLGERLLRGFTNAVPEVGQPAPEPDHDIAVDVRREIIRHIRLAAQQGNVVIVGRAGSAILGPRPDVVRVFVTAPLLWRIGHVMESLHVAEAEARTEIERIDRARAAFLREGWNAHWGDPAEYDAVLDTSRFGIEGTAAVIAAGVHAAERGS